MEMALRASGSSLRCVQTSEVERRACDLLYTLRSSSRVLYMVQGTWFLKGFFCWVEASAVGLIIPLRMTSGPFMGVKVCHDFNETCRCFFFYLHCVTLHQHHLLHKVVRSLPYNGS